MPPCWREKGPRARPPDADPAPGCGVLACAECRAAAHCDATGTRSPMPTRPHHAFLASATSPLSPTVAG
eukprot:1764162-Prymnesium_polylepis.1